MSTGEMVTRSRQFLQSNPTRRNKLVLVAVILLICVITTVGSDVFLTWGNWQNILQQISVIAILAIGTTLLMVSGGIDLSIGSNVSLSSVALAWLMVHHTSTPLAILAVLAMATGIGMFNGVLAAHARTHPFILTLGMLEVLQGLALLISTEPISGLPPKFLDFTFSRPLGLSTVVWFMIGFAIAAQFLLLRTIYGRYLYAMGGSEQASRLAGVRVHLVKLSLYGLMGLMVGVAAVLLTSMLSSGQAYAGQGMELSAIAAVAVGGTPLRGGRGDVVGTLLGVLLIGVISNSLNLLSIDPNLQYVIVGAIIVVAVMAQRGGRQ